MAELPAHPIFWSDFFADTEHMSEAAAKAYLFIIGHSWIRGGKLKNDDRLIARLCRLTLRRWLGIKDEVMEMLEVDDDGFIYQRRVRKDYVNVQRRSMVNSKNGSKGGKAKFAKKSNKNNDSDIANARNSSDVRQSETVASKTITKVSKNLGLGLERRSLRPGGHDPPTTKPDPDKFLMSKDWSIGPGTETRLRETFVPQLGVDPFWRQVERFIQHHCDEGTVDTQRGFCRSLENWLRRADANRGNASISGHANGFASGGTENDLPKERRCIGRIDDFIPPVLELCLAEKRKLYESEDLHPEEVIDFKCQLRKIYHDEDVVLGVSWGPNWTADEVYARLPEFDGFAKHDPSGQTQEVLAK